MRIGIAANLSAGEVTSVEHLVDLIAARAEEGYQTVWLANIFGVDALTVIAVAGRAVPDIELGTAVVPVYTRHPMALAQQALTTQAFISGRLALGIGLSHRPVVEGMWGMPFDQPARYMGEYLSVLLPLLRGESADVQGPRLSMRGKIDIPGAAPPSVLLAALGARMLRLCGSLTDGTLLWLTGAQTIARHIAPELKRAAAEAGRPPPRIVAGLPICVTDDVEDARRRVARFFRRYGELPSYRAMLDREGAAGPADVALVGSEEAVRTGLAELERAGATDFNAAVFGTQDEQARTMALLRAKVADGRHATV
jgi:F420-dependent oxidoreductase-like protein